MLKLRICGRIDRHFERFINVGIGEFAVSKSPHILVTWSLGSCLAIILYDKRTKIGGLAHAMLPNATSKKREQRGMFVDTAIADMLNEIRHCGALNEGITAAIIGGATIFNFFGELAIGEKNIKVAREIFRKLGIPIVKEEVGGNRGRNVLLDLEKGEIYVEITRSPIFITNS
ncbi:MAG: chemotaxis protein CheD [Candidatus Methanomethyliaceae archaeon]|nr:chemotaxis protein CheD [Candidatus Methanomethyliaceae archaeon]